jgi:hypothetical protein
MSARWGDGYRVNQLALTINADMRFHPKIPLISLAGLMHVRVTLFLFILG